MASQRAPSETYELPQTADIEQMQTRAAKTAAERLAAQHKRQTEKEKKLENKLYALKGSGSKPGSIQYHENQITRLQAELETESKKGRKGQLHSRIEKLTKSLEGLKAELPKIEEQLKEARESRTPVAKGRPPGIRGLVSSLFSPSK
jgi:predicted RNase H-like nuclease (RuvC/YqgF family)